MKVFIFGCFFAKVLAIFMIPTAIHFRWFWSTLFVPQCIITNDVVCGKEISRGLYEIFSTRSPLIPKVSASLKWFPQTCPYLLKPAAIEASIITIGAAEFFTKAFSGKYVFPATQVCVCVTPAICSFWRNQWSSGRLMVSVCVFYKLPW